MFKDQNTNIIACIVIAIIVICLVSMFSENFFAAPTPTWDGKKDCNKFCQTSSYRAAGTIEHTTGNCICCNVLKGPCNNSSLNAAIHKNPVTKTTTTPAPTTKPTTPAPTTKPPTLKDGFLYYNYGKTYMLGFVNDYKNSNKYCRGNAKAVLIGSYYICPETRNLSNEQQISGCGGKKINLKGNSKSLNGITFYDQYSC
jgi:hypothetical protein